MLLPRRIAYVAIVAGVLALAVFAYLALRQERAPDSAALAADFTDPALIERGRYLAVAGNCASCHTTPGGQYMAGGLAFETPFGTIYSTNITPDRHSGIGQWSAADFLNSMRHGVRPDGEHLYPVFPYTSFTQITDEDAAALYAFFMSIEPVAQEPPANAMPFPLNIRSLMAFWKLLFFEPGARVADASRSDEWNRGAYLVEALAHCGACHTPRNSLGAEERALAFSGGEYLDRVGEGAHRPWSAPNLTGAARGLALWSRDELAAYLHTGRNGFLETFGPMNEVIMNSTRHLRPADIASISTYLKSIPPIEESLADTPDPQTMGRGRTVYNLHCGTCHLPTGEGDPEMGPRLNRGSLVVQADNPASLINAILYAPQAPHPPLADRWRKPMEEFQWKLDDEEVAAVATYIRNSWDNAAGSVGAADVARQR